MFHWLQVYGGPAHLQRKKKKQDHAQKMGPFFVSEIGNGP
jgi:hypothetical protein